MMGVLIRVDERPLQHVPVYSQEKQEMWSE